jgi:hypothetical protein
MVPDKIRLTEAQYAKIHAEQLALFHEVSDRMIRSGKYKHLTSEQVLDECRSLCAAHNEPWVADLRKQGRIVWVTQEEINLNDPPRNPPMAGPFAGIHGQGNESRTGHENE